MSATKLAVSDLVPRPTADNSATSGDVAVTSRTTSTSCQHVDFSTDNDNVYVTEKQSRGRFLTAKYPKHQMGLIRRRLVVEDWIDEQLKLLFDITDEDYDTYDVELELDDLLNFDSDDERTAYIREKIANSPKSEVIQNNFIKELLEKAAAL